MNSDRNCGLCGQKTCADFRKLLEEGLISRQNCPFDNKISTEKEMCENLDTHNNRYDFLLNAIDGEPSARKIIRPFRTDLIERLDIVPGDIVVARPMGAGCPVTHVLLVYEVDELAGLLYTYVVGPKYSRNKEVKDIRAYNMIGFEGIADNIVVKPQVGKTAGFMPGFCMLRLTHYGLCNKVLATREGLLVRIEDIHIAH